MCHVLIIEDECLIAMHLALLLEGSGATSIDTAGTEDEAVALALSTPPAVIFSDVSLQNGTGPDAVRRIFSALGACEVVFVTAAPESCQFHGSNVTKLSKPVIDEVVISTFKAIAPHLQG